MQRECNAVNRREFIVDHPRSAAGCGDGGVGRGQIGLKRMRHGGESEGGCKDVLDGDWG